MAATHVLTIAEWNDLVARITNLSVYPPPGCHTDWAVPPEPVTAPHKWTAADITVAQNRLKDICPNATFTSATPGGKWRQAYIDELNYVLDNASAEWCGCQSPCCVPQGTGRVQINPYGYYVDLPFSQIVEQYLYGNVSYSDMVAAMGSDVVAHLEECVGPGTGEIIHYTYRHQHWVNCIYKDYWVDTGQPRYPWEDVYTCGNTETETLESGWVPAFAPNYRSQTNQGDRVYYDQPFGMGYHYDYQARRWYETRWIGAFDVDVYVYDLYVTYVCP